MCKLERASLRPGGWLVLSVRDYATLPRRQAEVRPYGLRVENGLRHLAVQVWDWDADGERYALRLYLTTEAADGRCTTELLRSRYYAVSIARLVSLLAQAGYVEVERHDDLLFQPVIVAQRPGEGDGRLDGAVDA